MQNEGEVLVRKGWVARFGSGSAAVVGAVADLALPPHCLACSARTTDHGALCAACWARLRLIEKPYCARLGTPFPHDLGEGALSLEAISDPPPFDRCRAVATYDDIARNLVHGLKYRDRLDLASWMARWMTRAGGELVVEADVIVAVPLHRWRLWWRRYNQSSLLAAAIAAQVGKPFAPRGLQRVRATRQQVGLSQAERARNVRGAFRVPSSEQAALAGRRVILVDDVYTTGATAAAATRALLRARAASVDVLVFARVVAGQS
jgi:ComF family protein